MFIGMSKREIISTVKGKASKIIYVDSKNGIQLMDIFFPMKNGSEKWITVWLDKTTRKVIKEFSALYDGNRRYEERLLK